MKYYGHIQNTLHVAEKSFEQTPTEFRNARSRTYKSDIAPWTNTYAYKKANLAKEINQQGNLKS